eukprot:Unigene14035_Nuclearia_a/m.42389 Unigene14035_Nuclearia_a/g.42389  ORF Unigene14035_Nuclearia_a/g.42389 Unigene14035_Nuclearia_a/m.42389 type:complete len:416 (-) Unigene14035_Nuclearia_a:224-1471(-)
MKANVSASALSMYSSRNERKRLSSPSRAMLPESENAGRLKKGSGALTLSVSSAPRSASTARSAAPFQCVTKSTISSERTPGTHLTSPGTSLHSARRTRTLVSCGIGCHTGRINGSSAMSTLRIASCRRTNCARCVTVMPIAATSTCTVRRHRPGACAIWRHCRHTAAARSRSGSESSASIASRHSLGKSSMEALLAGARRCRRVDRADCGLLCSRAHRRLALARGESAAGWWQPSQTYDLSARASSGVRCTQAVWNQSSHTSQQTIKSYAGCPQTQYRVAASASALAPLLSPTARSAPTSAEARCRSSTNVNVRPRRGRSIVCVRGSYVPRQKKTLSGSALPVPRTAARNASYVSTTTAPSMSSAGIASSKSDSSSSRAAIVRRVCSSAAPSLLSSATSCCHSRPRSRRGRSRWR